MFPGCSIGMDLHAKDAHYSIPVRLPNQEIHNYTKNVFFVDILCSDLQIHVDDMSVDILCSDLCDFRAKSVGAVSKNVF